MCCRSERKRTSPVLSFPVCSDETEESPRNSHPTCTFVTYFAFTTLSFRQDAQRLAESWGVPYIECSSKTGDKVAEVFHTLLKEIEKDDGLLTESGDNGCTIL